MALRLPVQRLALLSLFDLGVDHIPHSATRNDAIDQRAAMGNVGAECRHPLLSQADAQQAGGASHGNAFFDVTGDDRLDINDFHTWVADLRTTWIGDANLDGEFNGDDLITAFSGGKFGTADVARWTEGDFDGDQDFDPDDLVEAFAAGGYDAGPKANAAPVPEPTSTVLMLIFVAHALRARRSASPSA